MKGSVNPFVVLLIGFCFLSIGFTQKQNFNTQRNWSFEKKQLLLTTGITQFTGDLGGLIRLNAIKSKSMAFPSTSWGTSLSYDYRIHPYYALRSRLYFFELRGNDAMIKNDYRQARNLNFRSVCGSFTQYFKVILIANELTTTRLSFINNQRLTFHNFYAIAGFGAIFFNPQARYNSDWVDLYPLITEGQGLPSGSKSYHRVAITSPVGIGVTWKTHNMFRIGFELEYTNVFSDYVDDVGGNYYASSVLSQEVGPVSAYLSNPSKSHPEWFQNGSPRGNKYNDSFFSLSLTIYKNITHRKYRKQLQQQESQERFI